MSRLEEIKNELAVKIFPDNEFIEDYQTFSDYFASRHPDWFTNFHREVAEIYAKECSQASLEKASEIVYDKFNGSYECKQSITNHENIVLL